MGRGRKSRPLSLAILHGNPGQRALREHNIAGVEGLGDLWKPPDWMDEEQRAQWIHGVEYSPRGLLKETDRETFESWVCATVEYRRAVIAVRTEGQILKAKGRYYKNPRMAAMADQANIAMKASDRLGFSPVARASITKAHAVATVSMPGQLIGSNLAQYLEEKPDKLDG